MKKIINDKDRLVEDMLSGYAKAFSDRVTVLDERILLRKHKKDNDKVAVIIGNGSGHEPGMIDLVGYGLFDANVCGNIFTAPTPIDMMKAIKAVQTDKGVLILVSSHQGDILNAKMAVMLAKAEGINAKMVVLWDDISSAPKNDMSERRGSVGLYYSFKIVTSAAESGMDMESLIALAQNVRDNSRSLSVAVSSGTHPQTGLKTFELKDDEIEIGMGVHGEAGSGVRKLCSSKELVSYMMGALVDDLELKSGDQFMALV
ncbi:MAG: dihydroxyacetone kinase subunit DhaK, partial [Clostridia bacterium]